MNSFIKSIDIFGRPVQFLINNQLKKTTMIGGCLSIIVYLGMTILITSYVMDYLYKKQLNLNVETKKISFGPDMNYTEENFYVSVLVIDSRDFKPIKNYHEIFYLKFDLFQLKRLNGTSNVKWTAIAEENCTEHQKIYEENGYKSYYDANYLYQSTCISDRLITGHDFSLNGSFLADEFNQMRITINKCNQDILNQKYGQGKKQCKKEEEINDVLNFSYLELYFLDNYADFKNYGTPKRKDFGNYYLRMSNGLTVHGIVNFKQIKIETDQGFIFEDLDIDTFFAFESSLTDKSNFEPKVGLAYVDLVSSLNTQTCKRVYTKIQDIAARVSGIFRLLFMIGAVFTVLPTNYSIYGTCIESLFNYKYEGFSRIDKFMKENEKSFRRNGFYGKGDHGNLVNYRMKQKDLGVKEIVKGYEDNVDNYFAARTITNSDYFGIGDNYKSFDGKENVLNKPNLDVNVNKNQGKSLSDMNEKNKYESNEKSKFQNREEKRDKMEWNINKKMGVYGVENNAASDDSIKFKNNKNQTSNLNGDRKHQNNKQKKIDISKFIMTNKASVQIKEENEAKNKIASSGKDDFDPQLRRNLLLEKIYHKRLNLNNINRDTININNEFESQENGKNRDHLNNQKGYLTDNLHKTIELKNFENSKNKDYIHNNPESSSGVNDSDRIMLKKGFDLDVSNINKIVSTNNNKSDFLIENINNNTSEILKTNKNSHEAFDQQEKKAFQFYKRKKDADNPYTNSIGKDEIIKKGNQIIKHLHDSRVKDKFSIFDIFKIEFRGLCRNIRFKSKLNLKKHQLLNLMKYLDFLNVLTILRDSIYIKSLVLKEKELSAFKFCNSTINIEKNLHIYNKDIKNLVMIKDKINWNPMSKDEEEDLIVKKSIDRCKKDFKSDDSVQGVFGVFDNASFFFKKELRDVMLNEN